MPRLEGDRFKVLGAADRDELQEFVANRTPAIELWSAGTRNTFRFEFQQHTPTLGGNGVTAYPGDVLSFRGALLVVERAPKPAFYLPPENTQEGLFPANFLAGA